MMQIRMEENFITSQLIGEERKKSWEIEHGQEFRQLSLFDDWKPDALPAEEDGVKALFGEL